MTTKRTKCAYCGKRLKPETGHSPLNPLKLDPTTARHEVCRACGREQPPGSEWTDLRDQWTDLRDKRQARREEVSALRSGIVDLAPTLPLAAPLPMPPSGSRPSGSSQAVPPAPSGVVPLPPPSRPDQRRH
jgi:hypothetical protein